MPVVDVQDHHSDDNGDDMADDMHKLVTEHALYGFNIVKDTRHNPAMAMGLKIAQGKSLEVAEELLADVEDYAVADGQQQTTADITNDIPGQIDPGERNAHQDDEVPDLIGIARCYCSGIRPADRRDELVNDVAPDSGQQHIGAGGHKDECQSRHYSPFVAAGELQRA